MKTTINLSIDSEVKRKANDIFKKNGQKMSSVIELHLKEIIKQNAK